MQQILVILFLIFFLNNIINRPIAVQIFFYINNHKIYDANCKINLTLIQLFINRLLLYQIDPIIY
jgi:hypothetical protein